MCVCALSLSYYLCYPRTLGLRDQHAAYRWYVPSLRYTRGLGWRMHCGAEVTESSTNKLHHLSLRGRSDMRDTQRVREMTFVCRSLDIYALAWVEHNLKEHKKERFSKDYKPQNQYI
jgi:hypothetical protein